MLLLWLYETLGKPIDVVALDVVYLWYADGGFDIL